MHNVELSRMLVSTTKRECLFFRCDEKLANFLGVFFYQSKEVYRVGRKIWRHSLILTSSCIKLSLLR